MNITVKELQLSGNSISVIRGGGGMWQQEVKDQICLIRPQVHPSWG